MSVVSLTIPSRTYPIGETTGQRALPGTQHYTTATLSVDLTGWTDTSTTRFSIAILWSIDGGVTWQEMISCTQDHPPPYPTKIGGTTSTMTGSATYGVAFDPTHIRGRVIVESHAVTIGTITLTAS